MITIQLDMFLAERFDMYYIDQNGDKKRPYIIHRTSLGCYERTLAWLIEKYAGKFPTWLCPEQVRVLPISEKYADYAEKVLAELKKTVLTQRWITVLRRSVTRFERQDWISFLICSLLVQKKRKRTKFLFAAALQVMRA